MADRKPDRQSEHDAAVAGLASIYRDRDFSQWANPDGERNEEFGGRYPDVIVKSKEGGGYYLFEVETEDSVRDDEAYSQWLDYDSVWTVGWYLAVPAHMEAEAKRLCAARGIKHCQTKTWKRDDSGTFTFWDLPEL